MFLIENMKDIFKKIISGWYAKSLPLLIERKDYSFQSNDIVAIIGPRRVGKTFFMFQQIKKILLNHHKEEVLFLDFEDNRFVGIKTEELDELFIAQKELSDKQLRFLFFDEIQEVKYWSKFLRRLHNENKYIIFISGSSSTLLSKEIATELRGRYKSIILLPFSFQEFLALKHFVYTAKVEFSDEKGRLLRYFEEYLHYGGYPELVTMTDAEERRIKVKSYFETVFYKDLVERHKITNYEVMGLLMNFLLNNCASLFSVSKFEAILKGRGLNVSKKTISLYLKYLEEAFFIYTVEEFSYSARKRMMRPKKVYLIDTIFVTLLSEQFSPDNGKLLENVVLGELKRKEKEVYFFKGQKECDFVVKRGNKIEQVIQVCYTLNEKNKDRELKGLKEAMDFFKLTEGFLLTQDQREDIIFEGKKVKVRPVWKWLLEDKN